MRARVRLHGHDVGRLEESGSLTTFRFVPEYLALAQRPVLGRWFEDRLSLDFVAKRSQSQVPSFFQNVLPEVNSPLRTLLARKAGVPENRELQLLSALGSDLPGAMTVEEDHTVEEQESTDEIPDTATDPLPGGPLRFSLAGMQLKLSVMLQGERLTLPATSASGRFILKLPAPTLSHLPRNEHAMMTWARTSGLDVAPTRIVPIASVESLPEGLHFSEPDALLVERYDRPAGGGHRIHQEDFAQVFGVAPADKYGREARVTFDRMARVILEVAGRSDLDEFIRRLVFCILCQNPDAHLKNWSFWYPDPRRPRLSPAYDLASAAVYPDVQRELACRLADEWELSTIRTHHFGKLAARAGLSSVEGVTLAQTAAERIRDAWRRLPEACEVPADLAQALDAHLARTKLP